MAGNNRKDPVQQIVKSYFFCLAQVWMKSTINMHISDVYIDTSKYFLTTIRIRRSLIRLIVL